MNHIEMYAELDCALSFMEKAERMIRRTQEENTDKELDRHFNLVIWELHAACSDMDLLLEQIDAEGEEE